MACELAGIAAGSGGWHKVMHGNNKHRMEELCGPLQVGREERSSQQVHCYKPGDKTGRLDLEEKGRGEDLEGSCPTSFPGLVPFGVAGNACCSSGVRGIK